METSRGEGKRSCKGKMEESAVMEDEEEEEDEEFGTRYGEDDKKKRVLRKGTSGGGYTPPGCQVENCTTDMGDAKRYHKRHKVCEVHAKAPVVLVAGLHQRFCQQCSRFHVISEFDDSKRSCRRRLAGHNERRRKSSSEFHGEGPS
ncbi:hypothetical protein L1049_010579 [Liquidambar formosana]|uniref:Squamosa promoter-binding-like protein n=1 Tax=Liquidambar formosana TaxID=63359 RepID=A0AAP0R4J7_LIQFO